MPQLVPDSFFIDRRAGFRGGWLLTVGGRRLFQTERVEIFFRDAGEALISRDRVAAAERLRDDAGRAGRNGRLCSRSGFGSLRRRESGEFGVFVHGEI